MLCITANLGDAVDGAARAQFGAWLTGWPAWSLTTKRSSPRCAGPGRPPAGDRTDSAPDALGPSVDNPVTGARNRNITRHIDGCYNTTRLHTGLGYQTPSEAHAGYRAAA